MKAALFAVIFLGTQLGARAADTAYSALRVIGKRDGQQVLNRVVEVRGRNGTPQPAVWKVMIDEPQARGGVREVEVQRGRIISERTPTGRGVGNAMNFSQLNLDSEGAFTIVNQEARKAGTPFDRVEYLLKSGTGSGSPVWELTLFEGRTGRVGAVEVAADSGTILRQSLGRGRGPAAPVDNDRDYVDGRNAPPPAPEREYQVDRYDSGHSRPGEPFRSPADFFYRLGKRFERRGQKLENFFTGRGGREAAEGER